MNGRNLLRGLTDVDPRFLMEAEAFSRGRRKRKAPVIFLIAAVIGGILAGCSIYYALNRENLSLGRREVQAVNSERPGEETVSILDLSLAGVKGSPAYQGAKEWYEFLKNYDPDGSISQKAWEEGRTFPREYQGYNVYSQEMLNKLEEITKKYGLKLEGELLQFRSAQRELNYLGFEDSLLRTDDIEFQFRGGEVYTQGNFAVGFTLVLPEEDWLYPCQGTLYFCRSDCLSPKIAMLEDSQDWQEENVTVNGENLLVLRSPSSRECWVFCQRPDGFLALSMEVDFSIYEEGIDAPIETRNVMPRETLQKILDAFVFDFQIQEGDTAWMEEPEVVDNSPGITLKSVDSDGRWARIVLSATAPEGVDLSYGFQDMANRNFMEDFIYIQGHEVEDRPPFLMTSIAGAEDGDGKANTCDIVVEVLGGKDDLFVPGETWMIHLEDWIRKTWDNIRKLPQEEVLLKGEWVFPVEFPEAERPVEWLFKPTETTVSGLMEENGDFKTVVQKAPLTSIQVSRLGIRVCADSGMQWNNPCNPENPYTASILVLVLNDGTKMTAQNRRGGADGTDFTASQTIPFDRLEKIIFPDGTVVNHP